VAMQKAGLGDSEMTDRLRRTDQVFELTREQQNFLLDRGVSQRVVDAMLSMNRTADARSVSDRSDQYDTRGTDRSSGSGRY